MSHRTKTLKQGTLNFGQKKTPVSPALTTVSTSTTTAAVLEQAIAVESQLRSGSKSKNGKQIHSRREPPPRWKEMWDGIAAMRKETPAPVDTMVYISLSL